MSLASCVTPLGRELRSEFPEAEIKIISELIVEKNKNKNYNLRNWFLCYGNVKWGRFWKGIKLGCNLTILAKKYDNEKANQSIIVWVITPLQ